jgi:peroxiredoxin
MLEGWNKVIPLMTWKEILSLRTIPTPMKTLCLTFVLLLDASFLPAQDNCFEKCHENLKNSSLESPEANHAVFDALVGCKAPEFNVQSLRGETLRLSEMKGKVVVLNFWFATCSPCVAEMPALNNLVKDYTDKEVVFIAFGRNDREDIESFLLKHPFHYHIVASDQAFAEYYCLLSGWPTNMVIDKYGTVRQLFAGGFVDERAKTHAYNEMKPVIDKYLLE